MSETIPPSSVLVPIMMQALDEFRDAQTGVWHRNGELMAIRLRLAREFPDMPQIDDCAEAFLQEIEERESKTSNEITAQILADKEL
jgi:hypothetical protein